MRFERQSTIIGAQGQKTLSSAHVIVIGAGGLGCPVLTYLASAGVGHLIIIDGDIISMSNLNRQTLFGIQDIGKSKAQLAAQKLTQQYTDIKVTPIENMLEAHNVAELLAGATVIVDCVDSNATRLLVSDYAAKHNIFVIEGALNGFYGYCLLLGQGICLRCIGFGSKQKLGQELEQDKWPSLGTTAGVIGSIMANMTLHVLLNDISMLQGRIIHYDGKTMEFDSVTVQSSPNCPYHATP